MRALAGRIPRALRDHRSASGITYGAYLRAMVARLGPLPSDARPWLKQAGLLVLALDALAADVEAARAVLANGGRRARDKARATLARLERRQSRARAALESAERRIEELAGEPPQLDLARAIAAAQATSGAER